jgi:hypothetical protein
MDDKKQDVWVMDIDTYLQVIELALKNGKKPGDSIQEEFEEILRNRKNNIKHIGETNKDVDLLTGNLRENGLKILNLKEIERRKNEKDLHK